MTTSKPVNQVNLRNIVLEMLLQVNKGEKSHVALKSTLDKNVSLDKHQRSFITRLFQGTLERRIELDFIINQFSKTPVNKMKPVIREILRMGVYQIKYMDNVPVEKQLKEALGEINEDNEYIIFTDMLGGSVNQEAVKYLQYPNVYVITGMNLPIVLSVCLSLASCEKVNEDVIRNAIDDAKSQIVYVNDVMKNMGVDEDDE